MKRIHTHYDNLKVARDAPTEVIRAAYKSLSLKYHPDRNFNNPDAVRIMRIINSAYEVLSDPIKRREHDAWIAEQERPDPASEKPVASEREYNVFKAEGRSVPYRLGRFVQQLVGEFKKRTSNWLRGDWIVLGGVSVFLAMVVFNLSSGPGGVKLPPGSKANVHGQGQLSQTRSYIRPDSAPNGAPWPTTAAYVSGYKVLHVDGCATVTVDNSGNNFDVFAKLVFLDSARVYPVLVFYIPAYSTFTGEKLTAGTYDLRYRDLTTGAISRTESFSLKRNETADTIECSNVKLTLYKVPHGNMKTYTILEAEF